MCGRYSIAVRLKDIEARFAAQLVKGFLWERHVAGAWDLPRYNVAPSQLVPVVLEEDGQRRLELMRWGLIPSWAKDLKTSLQMINLRVGTVLHKPAFQKILKTHRCIVPADGFFEWKKKGKEKTPMRIVQVGQNIFGFAAVWSKWASSQGETIHSVAILTIEASDSIRSIHDRMPVILKNKEQESIWLNSRIQDLKTLEALLLETPKELEFNPYPVSKLVNTPKNDRPECIAFAQEEEPMGSLF